MSQYKTELAVATFDDNGIAQTAGWIQVYRVFPDTQEYFGTEMVSVQQGDRINPDAYLDAPVQPESADEGIYRTADGLSWEYRPDGRGKKQYQIALPLAQFENGFATVSGWTTVHTAHYETREYMGAYMSFQSVGTGLAAQAYLDKPVLPTTPDTAICRSPDQDSWIYVPDFRGKTAYDIQTGFPVTIWQLGELPSQVTLLQPKTPFDKWDGHQWVTDTEVQQQENEAQRQQLLEEAREQVAKVEHEARLNVLAWDLYGVKLMALDITALTVNWPQKPE